MAVDAVLSEAVFGQISLLTGNLTGKSLNFALFRTALKDFILIYFTKTTSKGHFPIIKITGKKKFLSGKEIIKTGKRSNRIGKFISVKIYDDFKNKLISLVGYYSQLTEILFVAHRMIAWSPFCNFVLCPVCARSEKLPCLLTPLLKGEYFFHVQGAI